MSNSDFGERAEGFMKGYKELVDKFSVDMVNYPMWVPSEQIKGAFTCIVQSSPVDLKDRPTPSPFADK